MDTNHYSCHAFNKSLPNGRASGSLTVSHDILTFTVNDQVIHFSSSLVSVKKGGANNRLIFFTHSGHPDWTFYTSDRAILNDSHLLNVASAAKVLNQAKQYHWRGWVLVSAVGFLIIAVPLFLLLRMDLFTGVVARQIPPDWEVSLGESAFAQYSVDKTLMDEQQAEALLLPLVGPLKNVLPSQRYDYSFYIADESSVNAFALPGGSVVIHSSLILEAESAEELLGVLAHEMMHIEHQHGVRNVIGAAGIYVLISAILGDVNGVLALLSSATPVLLNQSYSRRFETEADREGFELLVDANIDPKGLIAFFEHVKEIESEQLENIDDADTREVVQQAMSYLSTHPATDKRIRVLAQLSEGLPPGNEFIDLSKEFKALQIAVQDFAEKDTLHHEN